MNILLTADESAGYHAFQLLIKSKHTVPAVIAPSNHSSIHKLAEELQIPVLEPSNLTDPAFARWIRDHQIDVLLNVHLLYVIHPDILNALSVDAFNLHPGRLPEYAGLNTPSWAIYNGEKEQSVTLHHMKEAVDTGKIAYTSTFPIKPDDTGLTLSLRCAKEGMVLISKLLDDLSSDTISIPAIQQNGSARRHYRKKDIPQNGYLDWDRSAAEIDAFIRACNYQPFRSPWGFPQTKYKEREIGIVSVNLTQEPCFNVSPGLIGAACREQVPVATSDYWLMVKACFDGEKIVPADKFLEKGFILG